MILWAEHRFPGICLTAEENPRKPQIGDRLMKGLCDQSSPQMGSISLQMRSVVSHSTLGREKEGNKERMGFRTKYHILTNSMAYGTRRFNAAFTRALQ